MNTQNNAANGNGAKTASRDAIMAAATPITAHKHTVSSGTSLSGTFKPGEMPGKLRSVSYIKGQIEVVLGYARTRKEALAALDKALPPIMLQCVYHMEKHGDVSLADMLVKGLIDEDPTLAQEVIFWFRKYTPIAWDSEKKAYLDKSKGKTFDVKGAESTEYHEEPEVQSRREQSARKIAPFGPEIAFNRIKGLLSMLEKAQGDDGRGVAEGTDPEKLKQSIEKIVAFAQAVLNIPVEAAKTAPTASANPPASNEAESDEMPDSVPPSKLIKAEVAARTRNKRGRGGRPRA